jgi:hypothetical protein
MYYFVFLTFSTFLERWVKTKPVFEHSRRVGGERGGKNAVKLCFMVRLKNQNNRYMHHSS